MSDCQAGMGGGGLGVDDGGPCADDGLCTGGTGCRADDGGARAQAEAPAHALAPALAFQGLTFSYPDSPAPVLEDVCLSIEPGAFALLVGDTGSGKSTLLSLVKP